MSMLLPWKKGKGKRLSQLLTDHLAPPKRGASLLVETGFPTSIADIVVRNSNRFKNNNNNSDINNDIVVNMRRRKKKKGPSAPDAPIFIGTRSDLPEPEPTQDSSTLAIAPLIGQPLTPPRLLSVSQVPPDAVIVDGGGTGACGAGDHDQTNCEVVHGKRVFLMILKMFFVVILALGARKFAVGMALSAFLLLFLEYVCRRLGRLFVKFVSARSGSSCLVRLLKRHKKLMMLEGGYAGSTNAPIEEIEFDSNLASSKASSSCLPTSMMNDFASEIHVLQTSANLVPPVREIPSVKSEFNLQSGKAKWAMEEMAENAEEEVIEKKNQEVRMSLSQLLVYDGNIGRVTRRSKIKSKIKKFATKLNDSKLNQKNKKMAKASGSGNAKIMTWAYKKREFEVVSNDEFTSLLSSTSSGNSDDDQVNIEDSICPENNSSSNSIEDNGGGERNSLSGGHLVILVIVLAGLVGGRALALAFALSWFLLLKLGLGARLGCISNGS